MGWDIGGSGFKIVLSASVADVVRQYLGDDVREFLADHELKPVDIDCWVAHPGGPKVLHAMQEALELSDGALTLTWQSWRGSATCRPRPSCTSFRTRSPRGRRGG